LKEDMDREMENLLNRLNNEKDMLDADKTRIEEELKLKDEELNK